MIDELLQGFIYYNYIKKLQGGEGAGGSKEAKLLLAVVDKLKVGQHHVLLKNKTKRIPILLGLRGRGDAEPGTIDGIDVLRPPIGRAREIDPLISRSSASSKISPDRLLTNGKPLLWGNNLMNDPTK
jgi:hypothetical protein